MTDSTATDISGREQHWEDFKDRRATHVEFETSNGIKIIMPKLLLAIGYDPKKDECRAWEASVVGSED